MSLMRKREARGECGGDARADKSPDAQVVFRFDRKIPAKDNRQERRNRIEEKIVKVSCM